MKKLMYLKDDPILYSNETNRKLPMEEYNLFNDDTLNKIFTSSLKIDYFGEDWYRGHAVVQACKELFSDISKIRYPGLENKVLISRRVRGYILEFDLFLKHWEKYLIDKCEDGAELYKKYTHNAFDTNESYALICAFRNYMVHCNDIIHHINISFEGIRILVNRDFVLNDYDWTGAKKKLLKRQREEIDLLKAIRDSFEEIGRLQSVFIDRFITTDIISSCEYLQDIHNRLALINAKAFYIFDFNDIENKNAYQNVGYIELNWKLYDAILKKKEINE